MFRIALPGVRPHTNSPLLPGAFCDGTNPFPSTVAQVPNRNTAARPVKEFSSPSPEKQRYTSCLARNALRQWISKFIACQPQPFKAQDGGHMAAPERRVTPRFNLHTPLTFHRKEAVSEDTQEAKAINISTRGVYFSTNLGLCVGEALEVSLEVPKRVTGSQAKNRCFIGRGAIGGCQC